MPLEQEKNLAARREEARTAMEGTEHRQKRLTQEEIIRKRRREAVLAMESAGHRKSREAREAAERAKTAAEKAAQEQTESRARETEAKRRLTLAEQKRQQAEEEKTFRERLEKIEVNAKTIEELKRETKVELNHLRTLKNDLAEAVKQGVSMAKIALAEKERGLKSGVIFADTARPAPKRHRIFLTLSILVVTTVAVALTGLIIYRQQPQWLSTLDLEQFFSFRRQTPAPWTSEIESIIFADTVSVINLNAPDTKDKVMEKINQLVSGADLDGRPGIQYLHFVINQEPANLTTVLHNLNVNLPEEIARSLNQKEFMIGVYHTPDAPSSFIVLVSDFFERTFSGLLRWEKTMIKDLGPLFVPAAVSGSADYYNVFSDKIILNKDTRILKANSGETVLLYTFLDNRHALIARNETVMTEILKRFIAVP